MDDFGGILDLLSLNDIELQQRCIQGSSIAEEILTVRYTRLVRACARPYYLAGGDSEDLVQEGMIGLLSAIRNFIPKKDVSFSSYAELCIKRRLFSAIKSANTQKNKPLNEGISLQYLQNENSKENFLLILNPNGVQQKIWSWLKRIMQSCKNFLMIVFPGLKRKF